jgi:hypothetical protein
MPIGSQCPPGIAVCLSWRTLYELAEKEKALSIAQYQLETVEWLSGCANACNMSDHYQDEREIEFCEDRLNIEFNNLCYYPPSKKGELIWVVTLNWPVINSLKTEHLVGTTIGLHIGCSLNNNFTSHYTFWSLIGHPQVEREYRNEI